MKEFPNKHIAIQKQIIKSGAHGQRNSEDLRSRGMKTSTTFPYLSNRGNKSSAVVPANNMKALITYRDFIHIKKQKKKKVKKSSWGERRIFTEGDVEDEERVGVSDVRGARSPEVRHFCAL